MNFRSLEEFWAYYVNQHSKRSTRRWHFAGTLSSIVLFIYSLLFNWWFLVLVPICGYGLAWYSYFFVEGNVPATFGHPVWSFLCDFRMFGVDAYWENGQGDQEAWKETYITRLLKGVFDSDLFA
ncbi:putative anion transporter 3 [Hibiscus syriacus]|uniref:Anion transporter 3 n=1 Tax=Hibiscus syriacus TaxID=106335 RepID=A0A6A3CLV2_HIBSY|nr:putative anion transporter 3 [Hibiscus syriacus]